VSALVGDLYRAVNPFQTLAAPLPAVRGEAHVEHRLGHWPAAGLLLAFVWLELIYPAGPIPPCWLSPSSPTPGWCWQGPPGGVVRGSARARPSPPSSGSWLTWRPCRPSPKAGSGFGRRWRRWPPWAARHHRIRDPRLPWPHAAGGPVVSRPRHPPPGRSLHPLPPHRGRLLGGPLLSFLMFEGQGILAAASDPFGRGWDLFGHRRPGHRLRGGVHHHHCLGAGAGHRRRARCRGGAGPRPGPGPFPPRVATRSEYPLLAAMVLFTVGGLTLLISG